MQGFILILCLVTWSDNQRQCQENDLNMFLMVCTHTDTPEGERERERFPYQIANTHKDYRLKPYKNIV